MQSIIQGFHLPRYQDLPNMGLYLEQATKYVNHFLAPLGCIQLTSSMVSNYVKKGLIPSPVNRQYFADQLGYLFFVAIAKQVLSMEHIIALVARQRSEYKTPDAYNYFCCELENMLYYVFGLTDTVEDIGVTHSQSKTMLRSLIVAAAQIIYLDRCLVLPAAQPPAEEKI